ncbi:MAG: hypothetical protein H0T53_15185 [Herpetosiphonaceae bacterium]|nr:hypothetical protein [Herpetosiphonaceae bacterium]
MQRLAHFHQQCAAIQEYQRRAPQCLVALEQRLVRRPQCHRWCAAMQEYHRLVLLSLVAALVLPILLQRTSVPLAIVEHH